MLPTLTTNPYIEIVITICSFFILAFLVNLLLKSIAKRITEHTPTKVDDKILESLKLPIFLTILLFGIYTSALHISGISTSLPTIQKTLFTLGFIIWGTVIGNIAHIVFEEVDKKSKANDRKKIHNMIPLLNNSTKLVVGLVILLTILSTWEINVTPILASAGVAGVAIAFAAKDMVANLFGGISVFFDKPYKLDDYVIINEIHRGQVIDIGMRSTKIKTRDNVLITVPNSVMVTNAVVNETGFDPKLRIRIPFLISYNSDLSHVEDVIMDILLKNKSVMDQPEPIVRFREFSDSGIKVEALATITKPSQRGKIVHTLIKEIHKELKIESIIIPYPQRDVHMHMGNEPNHIDSIL